jgi:thioredoxin-related protein
MKKLLLLVLFCSSFFSFSQGNKKMGIDWITLEKAEQFAKKYNTNILILFYRPGCEYCEKMKEQTLTDPTIIKLINENFLPVMINGKSKKPIVYNEKKYINDVSIEEDPKSTWRHNLFFELVAPTNNNHYWPTIVILNGKHEKLAQFPGFQSKEKLLRDLKKIIK